MGTSGGGLSKQRGWLMLLSNSEDSAWGSVDGFFDDILSEMGDATIYDLKSDVWGKFQRKGMAPKQGDGLAFYHTTRARFPPGDLYRRRARVTLLGELLDLKCDDAGSHISWISVRLSRSDLDRLRAEPIVRDDETEALFQACGMIPTRSTYSRAESRGEYDLPSSL